METKEPLLSRPSQLVSQTVRRLVSRGCFRVETTLNTVDDAMVLRSAADLMHRHQDLLLMEILK